MLVGRNGRCETSLPWEELPGTVKHLLLPSPQSRDCLGISLGASQLGSAGTSFRAMR